MGSCGLYKKGFKILEHTADEYISAYGSSLEEAFEKAALAMFEVMTDTSTVEPRNGEAVEAEAEDESALLYSWLEKFLIKFDADGKLYSRFEVTRIEKRREGFHLEATVWGEPYDPDKHPSRRGIKAVTYYKMEILREEGIVTVNFVLDI